MSAPDAKRAKIEMEEDPESLEVQKYQDQIEELNEKARYCTSQLYQYL